jgi:hypothetical protein
MVPHHEIQIPNEILEYKCSSLVGELSIILCGAVRYYHRSREKIAKKRLIVGDKISGECSVVSFVDAPTDRSMCK